jgi:hypothetical protein
MGDYPVEVRRCQHIKVNGTQCGSPALRNEKVCYFHSQCRVTKVAVTEAWKNGEIVLSPFEDAGSIQFTLRQIAQMLLEQKITEKKAGLLLYTLQIASSNLKQMNAEKPRPTQVVVDPETVGETPLGETPWSASGEGHDPEEEWEQEQEWASADEEPRLESKRQAEESADDIFADPDTRLGSTARVLSISQWLLKNPESTYKKMRHMLECQMEAWRRDLAPASIPFGPCEDEDELPPETIQACEERKPYVV